jgi:antitoxin ParD1/3/4
MADYAILTIMKIDTMTSMNISLPDSMRQFVEVQVSNGAYGTISEYFRGLVREDKKRKAQEQLEELLLAGLNSGEATPMTEQDWTDIRAEVKRRALARKGNK